MKKLIIILLLTIFVNSAFSQNGDIRGRRVFATEQFLLRNYRVDTIANDTTNWNIGFRKIPTAQAVYDFVINRSAGGGSMVYPSAGIAVSTGSAWGTSITNNSTNWNTAFGWGNHAGLYPSVSRFSDSLANHWAAILLRQNISDTNTYDATRWWVQQQGFGQNFATADLNFSASRSHDGGNYDFEMFNFHGLSFQSTDIYLTGQTQIESTSGTNYVQAFFQPNYIDIRSGNASGSSQLVLREDSSYLETQKLVINVPSKGAGKVLTSDANGVATWQPSSGGTIPTLQEVTDEGNETTNDIVLNTGGSNYIKMWNDGGIPVLELYQTSGSSTSSTLNTDNLSFGNSSFAKKLLAGNITGNRNITFPDSSGTVALLSNIPSAITIPGSYGNIQMVRNGALAATDTVGYTTGEGFKVNGNQIRVNYGSANSIGLLMRPISGSDPYTPLLAFQATSVNTSPSKIGNDYAGQLNIESASNFATFGNFYTGLPTVKIRTYSYSSGSGADNATINISNPDAAAVGLRIKGYTSATGNLFELQNSGATGLSAFDAAGKLGIGNIAPSEMLDVSGKTKTSELQITTGASDGYVLRSDPDGNSFWDTPLSLYHRFGRIGEDDDLGTEDRLVNGSSYAFEFDNFSYLRFSSQDSTTIQTDKLIIDIPSKGAAKVLTSDANGNATWQVATAGSEVDPVVSAITGIVKSNGTTISAATAGTDYENPLTFTDGLSRTSNTVSTNINSETADTITLNDEILFSDADNSNAIRKATIEHLMSRYMKEYLRSYAYEYRNEFINTVGTAAAGNDIVATNSGTGAATAVGTTTATNIVGLVRTTTGTTATGRSFVNSAGASIRLGGGAWVYEINVNPTTLSTVTERYQQLFGFFDTYTAANQVDGAYFLYDEGGVSTSSAASANWQLVTVSNSTRTFTTTSTAVAAGSWVKLRVEINPAASRVDFFINGTNVGNHTTNIPTAAGRELGFGWGMIKSIGTTARTCDVDYLIIQNEYTTTK